jgi:imidazolonepropionase-like amidohydrolase
MAQVSTPVGKETPYEGSKIVLDNINIFTGKETFEHGSIAIRDGKIVQDAADAAVVIDMKNAYAIPGLIDSHVHIHGLDDLAELAKHGVTTGLDMGTASLQVFASGSLRDAPGVADIRSAGIPATSPGSRHSKIPGFPSNALVQDTASANAYVEARIAEGADYIKIMADSPGPDQATINALVVAAHKHGKLSIAHTTKFDAVKMAQDGGVDVITHVPMDKPLDAAGVTSLITGSRILVPTLVKMKGTAAKAPHENDYTFARDSVKDARTAGVTILAGSDANKNNSGPAGLPYGEGLHQELELLVDAGFSPIEALLAATYVPAQHFDLHDRGSIEVGKRADLLVLSENPIENISATRSIQRVFIKGVERAVV